MKTRKQWLFELARLHREKWQTNGDIKLLLIAAQLDNEAALWPAT